MRIPWDDHEIALLFDMYEQVSTGRDIADLEKQILTFLKNEKESEIEGDLTTLTRMIKEYKFNWDNELYCKNNHSLLFSMFSYFIKKLQNVV